MTHQAPRTLIVGGTSGMGLASARALVESGHQVIVAGRRAEGLRRALDLLGPEAQGITMDMTVSEDVSRGLAEVGPVDHLVLAGSSGVAWGPIHAVGADRLSQALAGKLVAYWDCIQQVLPTLRVGGSITLFSGAASRKAMPGTAALAAVNGGLNAFAHTLAVELAPTRVNVLSPGLIDTAAYDGMPEADRQALMKGGADRIPIGRLGTTDEVGKAAAMLVHNSYLSGALLDCDGGTRL